MKKANIEKLNKIMAYDICAILDDAEKGDLAYLISWLTGEGLTQYKDFDDKDVEAEWKEGEYDGCAKRSIVESSPTYERFEYVRNLWDKGDDRGVWDGEGSFYGPQTKKFKAFGKRG